MLMENEDVNPWEAATQEDKDAVLVLFTECLQALYEKAGLPYPEEFDPQHEAERIARALEL